MLIDLPCILEHVSGFNGPFRPQRIWRAVAAANAKDVFGHVAVDCLPEVSVADLTRQTQTQHESETAADMQTHASCQAESSMPQVDFAPSMAALMGVPIPFGSIGQISRRLWNLAHSMRSNGPTSFGTDTEGDDLQQGAYAEALRENAAQVGGCTFVGLDADWLCGPLVLGTLQ